MNKKKLLIIISAVIFIFLILIICLFFYFRYKNNLNLAQTSKNNQVAEQIINQNNIQDINKNSNENKDKDEDKNLNFENSKERNSNNLENKQLEIKIEKLTYYEQFGDKKLKIKIEVEYPIILNENHSDFIDKINKKNKMEAEKEFNRCKLDLKQTAETMIEAGDPPDITLYYVEECKVTRNDNIISMAIKGAWYAYGTHDIILESKNYDLKNKKELTLADILNGSKKNIDKMITEKVEKYLGNNHDLYYEYFQDHDLKDYKFHIENENSQDILVIDFSKYEISEGAAGAILIEIPFSEIKQKYKIDLKI